jgi:hypothetical protein
MLKYRMRICVENLIVARSVKIFHTFCGTRRPITEFTSSGTAPNPGPAESTAQSHISWMRPLYVLRLCLHSGLLPSIFPTVTVYVISTALFWLLGLYLDHYMINKLHGCTLICIHHFPYFGHKFFLISFFHRFGAHFYLTFYGPAFIPIGKYMAYKRFYDVNFVCLTKYCGGTR